MSIRIVIADDHSVFRDGLRALLEKQDDMTVVAEAATGPQAVQAATQEVCDVLLLDLSLPEMPGSRVAREVLRQKPGLAILVLTMHEDVCYLRELMATGARGYLLKKATGTDLVQAIRAVHAGRQYLDPAIAGHVIASFLGRPEKKSERLSVLTPREQEICGCLALGYTNEEIAHQLHISNRTVETHRANIMTKLEIKSRAELVRFALINGLMKHD